MKWYIGTRIQSRLSGSRRNGAATADNVLRARFRQQAARPIRSANVCAWGTIDRVAQDVVGHVTDIRCEVESIVGLTGTRAGCGNALWFVEKDAHFLLQIGRVAVSHDEPVLAVAHEIGDAASRADDDRPRRRH